MEDGNCWHSARDSAWSHSFHSLQQLSINTLLSNVRLFSDDTSLFHRVIDAESSLEGHQQFGYFSRKLVLTLHTLPISVS